MRILLSICILTCILSCCDEPAYVTYTVRIYTENTHRYTPTVFETFTEQVITKSAYHEGATFETVTEQVLVKEGHHVYKISSQEDIHLVTDAETYVITTLPCISFFSPDEYELTEVPDVYATRSYQKLVQDGNGPFNEASYAFRELQRIASPAILEEIGSSQRTYLDYRFHIPSDMSIDTFIHNQLSLQELTDCLLEGSYIVL